MPLYPLSIFFCNSRVRRAEALLPFVDDPSGFRSLPFIDSS